MKQMEEDHLKMESEKSEMFEEDESDERCRRRKRTCTEGLNPSKSHGTRSKTESHDGVQKLMKRVSKPSLLLVIGLFLALSILRSSSTVNCMEIMASTSEKSSSPANGPSEKEESTTLHRQDKIHNPTNQPVLTTLTAVSKSGGDLSGTPVPNYVATTPKSDHDQLTTVKSQSSEEEGSGDFEDSNEKKNQTGMKCIPPAIVQFPRPMFSQKARLHYGLVLMYLVIALYAFIGLAIMCDEFFVPSLDLMCEMLQISPDVAGATFMAAGSSAPELATALIGVFVAEDDIGISGVIGSAVFNIMFVISICALLTPTVLYLSWWPLVRDCFFYMISILALLATIYDEYIEWYESIILLLLYVAYCFILWQNNVIEAMVHTLPIKFPVHAPTENEQSELVSYRQTQQNNVDGNLSGSGEAMPAHMESFDRANYGAGDIDVSLNPGGEMGTMAGPEPPNKVPPATESLLTHFNAPTDSVIKQVLYKISMPLVYLFYYTVPDCRLENWKSWYLVTFILSLVWIAFFSYIMVWMITVIGYTVGIPDTVMGLTFVAAGVSVPDALSSVAVIKEGYGDMAVSNAVGSNVFDILVCLGLPWFLSTAIVNPGKPVKVISKGLTYSTFSLLSTVAFLLLATHYNGWKLDKKYGVILMMWYIFFMIFATMYELNIFADFNPPECVVNY